MAAGAAGLTAASAESVHGTKETEAILRALITGYGGFAGGHLANELLRETDWQVWGTRRRQGEAPPSAQPGIEQREGGTVRTLELDLRDPIATRRAIDQVAPDRVFHLAGQAFVPAARRDPWGSFEANVRMQINLLEALAGSRSRILVVTSCEVYGAPETGSDPIDERATLAPINAYATSKAAQDMVAWQYTRSHGLDLVRARPFNHIGPGQDLRFVLPAFARQIARIEAGRQAPRLSVGNLDAQRDFSDVRDIVRAYRLLAERGRSGAVYNLGSGQARPISAIVDALRERATVDIEVETDLDRLRPNEIPAICCDSGRARAELGWTTTINFNQSIDAVLAEWRAREHTSEGESLSRTAHAS
ncbi:MAG: GDP-mannose 4,6-dehydratase [Deltaproteobacteria bacterium]|nr:GDP-mannose 4,6-dehydratase [Deltaproteobacteria bacterium]